MYGWVGEWMDGWEGGRVGRERASAESFRPMLLEHMVKSDCITVEEMQMIKE